LRRTGTIEGNSIPTDLKARVLTTNIDLDEGSCSLDLQEAASEFFALTLAQARAIIKEVASMTAPGETPPTRLELAQPRLPYGHRLRTRRAGAGAMIKTFDASKPFFINT
jgi:hypothetical protein